MPLHTFSVQQPPDCVIKKIHSLFADFLWGRQEIRKKLHWISWQQICTPKEENGLGIRSLSDVLKAFSYKLWWRYRQQTSLWARYLHDKYAGIDGHPLQSLEMPTVASNAWKRMLKVSISAEENMRCLIGKGDSSLWFENWTGLGLLPCGKEEWLELKICDIMSSPTTFNHARLVQLFDQTVVQHIHSLLVSLSPQKDRLVWTPVPSGSFEFSSAWEIVRKKRPQIRSRLLIWNSLLPPKISLFMWRLLNDALSTDKAVQKRGIALCSKCHFCNDVESTPHLFLQCLFAQKVWAFFSSLFGFQVKGYYTFSQLLLQWNMHAISPLSVKLCGILPSIICYEIWLARCDARFDDTNGCLDRVKFNVQRWIHNIASLHPFPSPTSSFDISLKTLWRFKCHPRIKPSCKVVRWSSGHSPYVLNTDGSATDNKATGGGVLRSQKGVFIVGFSSDYGQRSNTVAEAYAFHDGIKTALVHSAFPLLVQLDSLIIVKAFNGEFKIPWAISPILERIKDLVRDKQVQVTHIYREANQVADALALHGQHHDNCSFNSFLDLPIRVKGLLKMDYLGVATIRRRTV